MEVWWVCGITVVAIALFISERWPAEIVALLVLGALVTVGLVTPKESLSGFANPATITVAAMFVVSAALRETGALDGLARLLALVGVNGPALLLTMIALVATVSAFINNTAAVAVFLPVVLTVAHQRHIPTSKLLIPLSYASQFGGVCTLIGTSTNLLVNSVTKNAGLPSIGLFVAEQRDVGIGDVVVRDAAVAAIADVV
ncbi:SLC13 family permease [Tahibacter amnicola]|uniref:SLC13 family permease n=1 Tax=Tahibacter amnicola TaxID=2976241 RepID=UPI003CCCC082